MERPEPRGAALLDLTGQVALVTGGGRGIGRAVAEVLLEAGASVVIASRGAAALVAAAEALAATHGDRRVLAIPTDVADEAAVAALLAQLVARHGQLDVLVNNAGLIHFGPIDQITPASWQAVLAANLTGAYLCARAAAPLMQQRRHGRIINIASVSGHTGGISAGVDYAASKGGMLTFTKTLARDLAGSGITVNAIAPGQIDADPLLLNAEARQRVEQLIPLGRLGTPREVAHAVLFLASPMASYITGATIDVNGGILKR
jgi:3-oxoacyl-[acyl-carrier protein] reductase